MSRCTDIFILTVFNADFSIHVLFVLFVCVIFEKLDWILKRTIGIDETLMTALLFVRFCIVLSSHLVCTIAAIFALRPFIIFLLLFSEKISGYETVL